MTRHDDVRQSTAPEVNRAIRERTDEAIHSVRRDPDRIRERILAIDAEWNVERALEIATGAASVIGLGLGLRGRRGGLAIALAAQGFLLEHATLGWCPAVPLLRRLGFRTQQEIERERYTLRALLRDRFDTVHSDRPAELPADRGPELAEQTPPRPQPV